MSPFIAARNLWHRHLTARDAVALMLLVVSVTASISTWVQYERAHSALKIAIGSRDALRTQRKLTDLHFCHAINQNRQINNRDHETFIRAREETRADLRKVKDPVLHDLLARSLIQTARELKARPLIPLLHCVQVIQHPSGELPPQIRTEDTTTG